MGKLVDATGRPMKEGAQPVVWVQDEEGNRAPLPGVACFVLGPQAQQAVYQVARAACMDALRDVFSALGGIVQSAFAQPAAAAPDEKSGWFIGAAPLALVSVHEAMAKAAEGGGRVTALHVRPELKDGGEAICASVAGLVLSIDPRVASTPNGWALSVEGNPVEAEPPPSPSPEEVDAVLEEQVAQIAARRKTKAHA